MALLCTGILVAACAGTEPESEAPNVYDPSESQSRSRQAWDRFNAEYENKWRVRWNPVTGTPASVRGHFIPIEEELTPENVEAAARVLLVELKPALQVEPDKLVLIGTDFRPSRQPGRSGGTWYVSFRQSHRDLSVSGGSVRLIIRDGKVTNINANFYPGVEIATDPRIALAEAAAVIRSDMGADAALDPIDSKLIVYPRPFPGGVEYHLAWQVTMPISVVPADPLSGPESEQGVEPVQWRYFVDARTGRILARTSVLATESLSGNVKGHVHPQQPTDTPEPRDIPNLAVGLSQGGVSLAPAQTDAEGNYLFQDGDLSAGPAELEAFLKGPHVHVDNAETDDPDASHSAAVTLPGTHSWSWEPDDPSPGDVETNVFHHVNWIRNWFLGIDPGLLEAKPHPMPVEVRSIVLGTPCNASASESGLTFGKGKPGTCADFGLCADTIYHEYTHRVVQTLYDEKEVPLPYAGFTGALNEGWADYFSSSATDDSSQLEVCWPSKSRDLATADKQYPQDWADKVHDDGLIIGGALWDLRAVLGKDYVDALALLAIKNTPLDFGDYLAALLEADDDTSFSTDPSANGAPEDGTPNIDAICQAFFDLHGVYDAYCAGHTNQAVAVITDPSPISSFNLFDKSAGTVSVIGSAAGSAASPLQNYVLEYANAGAPDTWVAFGGGTAPVGDDVLGALDLGDPAAVPDGFYYIRLTVTTADASSATAIVALVIDRALMEGWPQELGTYSKFFHVPAHFRSPAVADLDPDYPGLEIVAQMWARPRLYVWHADGTPAFDWPAYGVFSNQTAPAVGDLDADGDLEIVVHTQDGALRVFNHDKSDFNDTWPQNTFEGILAKAQWSTPALADLDLDGDLEIVVGSTDNKIYAWTHDGNPLEGWPVTVGGTVRASPAVGNIDGEGSLEIVINSDDGLLHVLTLGGAPLEEWPKELPINAPQSSSPVLGDIDGDGDLEIFIGAGAPLNYQLFAWHHDGTPILTADGDAAWPQTFPDSYVERPGSLALANLDGDPAPEVLARARNGNVYAWNGDGTPVAGWPPVTPGATQFHEQNSSPAAADLDGIGGMDVVTDLGQVTQYGTPRYEVGAYRQDGAPVPGWPKFVNSDFNTTPVIADIDLDGDAEVLVGSHGMFVWDLPGSFDMAAADWPFYRQNLQRTGAYRDTAPPVITMSGASDVTIEACSVYTVPPATAFDNLDGDLTDKIEVDFTGVNTQVPGAYQVTWTVSDSAGNEAVPATQTVNVVDTTPPVIALLGPPEVTIPLGGAYKDAGAIATDCVDGEVPIPNAGSDLNVDMVGTYSWVYFSVTDKAGNESQPASRTIFVVDGSS